MKITLRKANALQNSIWEVVRSIQLNTTIDLNEFQDVNEVLASVRDEVMKNDLRRKQLLDVVYAIRAKVSSANNDGVNRLLCDAAYIDKRIAQIEPLVNSPVTADLNVLEGKINQLKQANADGKNLGYGYRDAVSTSVLSREMIEEFKQEFKELKKQKQTINDRLLELNIKTEIELGAVAVKVLTEEGLL